MKKYLAIILAIFSIVPLYLCVTLINGCASTDSLAEKQKQVQELKDYISSIQAETTFAVDSYAESVKNDKTPAKIDTEATVEPFYTIGETATMSRSTIKLLEAKEFSPKEDYAKPQDGYVFVGVKVEITNITTDRTHYATTDAADAYCNDVLLDDSYYARISAPGDEASGDIAPGKKLVGWFSFEAPADWEEIEVVYQDIGYFWSDKVTFKFAK